MAILENKNFRLAIIYLLIIFSYYCSLIIGTSWDEPFEITRGQERLKYILSFGSYEVAPAQNDKYYPGLYSTISAFISNILPKKYIYETFHIINNTFSILTIFGLYKLTKLLFNKNVAFLSLIILFLNPTFFGHMSVNSKDTIIAFSFVWTTLTLFRYLDYQKDNDKRKKFLIYTGLLIGLGLGVRIQFFALLIPLFLFVFLYKFNDKKFSLGLFVFDSFLIIIISYLVMVLCWPQVHSNIIIEPFKIFFDQFKIGFGPDRILLNNKIFSTSEVPPYYLFTNLLFKSPEFILFTYTIFLFLIFFKDKFRFNEYLNFYSKLFLIFLILTLPTIFILVSSYKLYDGLRLFIYIIPFYCIIPALVISFLIKNIKYFINRFLMLVISLLFALYIYNFVKITPYQYTYFNLLAGKKVDLVNKFEIDYWGVSLKELVNKITKKNYKKENGFTNIAVCGLNVDIVKFEFNKYPNFKYKIKHLLDEQYQYVIMNNRPVFKENEKYVNCYTKFNNKSVIDVKRGNQTLSSFRKIN
tara:strand:- start:93 stop:1670 length:1578 start_codon:yes stop_codon:yes gene_type:complete